MTIKAHSTLQIGFVLACITNAFVLQAGCGLLEGIFHVVKRSFHFEAMKGAGYLLATIRCFSVLSLHSPDESIRPVGNRLKLALDWNGVQL